MATYCTRIYVKVDSEELMHHLCGIDVSDIGKGFYSAKDFFKEGTLSSYFCDTESGINEDDIHTIVKRVAAIIQKQGLILADTWSYDYDPFPEVCFYNGDEITAKLLEIDGEEFNNTANIKNTDEWINYVEGAECIEEEVIRLVDEQAENALSISDKEKMKYFFGSYKGKAIEWDVIDKKDCAILLFNADGNIDDAYRAYETDNYPSRKYVADWNNSSARAWLNSELLNLVFNDEERGRILATTVVTGDQIAEDQVFLLSQEEVEHYYPEKESRILSIYIEAWKKEHITRWWTRTPAKKSCIMEVGEDGSISKMMPDYPYGYLRMALWISITE